MAATKEGQPVVKSKGSHPMCTVNVYGMFDINMKEFQCFFLAEDQINPKGSHTFSTEVQIHCYFS